MNKYTEQQIITAIQKAVPEIMELRDGCIVIVKFDDFSEGVKCVIVTEKTYDSDLVIVRSCESWECLHIYKKMIVKIIGRPITLDDIQETYLKKNNDVSQSEAIVRSRDWVLILSNWTPNKPFTEQSKETKELIGDLTLK